MLIYCAQFNLVPGSEHERLLGTCAEWLNHKTQATLSTNDLLADGERRFRDGSRIEWLTGNHDNVLLQGIRYAHPDRATRGRSWVTEIGIHRSKTLYSCSILLRTEEKSALVDPFVQTTRPKLAASIVERCVLSSEMCGAKPKPLRLEDAEAFLATVNNPERRYPIVQISPTADGFYLISPQRAALQLAGIAVVTEIVSDAETHGLAEVLSPRYSCYRGAVNIIWPPVGSGSGTLIAYHRILAAEIEAVIATGVLPEGRLLAILCDRLNDAYARGHITPEMVRAAKHRSALDEARRSAALPDPELAQLARVVDEEQRAEIASLRTQLASAQSRCEEFRDRLADADYTIAALKASLDASGARFAKEPKAAISDEVKVLLRRAMGKDATLADGLEVISLLFPDRVLILDSAWKSARDAESFKHPRKAFDLLYLLCSDYAEALVAGKSDADARAALGASLSTQESETVGKNRRARNLRTFQYKGRPTEMMMHLKIGTKDSVAETFRAHFEWDPVDKKIVIGHCGKHLDHR